MINLNARLKTLDADCENAARVELDKLFEDAGNGGATSRPPSPQAVEAVWLRLIGEKEYRFIQEIDKLLEVKSGDQPAAPGPDDISTAEKTIDALFADDRYLERMQEFYQEVARKAVPNASSSDASSFDAQAKRLDLIDATYRTGVKNALRKARHNVLAKLESYKLPVAPEDISMISQWKRYSTLSPWRSIGTIVLLSLTSYLIAFIIASDTFRAILERLGWSTGTGL
jgi:hypothetical protein